MKLIPQAPVSPKFYLGGAVFLLVLGFLNFLIWLFFHQSIPWINDHFDPGVSIGILVVGLIFMSDSKGVLGLKHALSIIFLVFYTLTFCGLLVPFLFPQEIINFLFQEVTFLMGTSRFALFYFAIQALFLINLSLENKRYYNNYFVSLSLLAILAALLFGSIMAMISGLEATTGLVDFVRISVLDLAYFSLILIYSFAYFQNQHRKTKRLTPLLSAIIATAGSLTGVFIISEANRAIDREYTIKENIQKANYMRYDFERSLLSDIETFARLGERWGTVSDSSTEQIADLQAIIQDITSFQEIYYYSSQVGLQRRIQKQGLAADEVRISQLFPGFLERIGEYDSITDPVFYDVVQTDENLSALLLIPVPSEEAEAGTLVAEYLLSQKINRILSAFGSEEFSVIINGFEENLISDPEQFDQDYQDHGADLVFNVVNLEFRVKVIPDLDLIVRSEVITQRLFLIFSILLGCLTFYGVYNGEVARRSEEEISLMNDILSQEMSNSKRISRQFELANIELTRSNRDLQEFAQVASHDLQEPLRKIIAFSGRLELFLKDKLDEKHRDYLSRMTNSVHRMSGLINDLLEFSRISTKGNPQEPIDPNLVLANVISDLETRIEEKSAQIEILAPLPRLIADPMQLQQLFQNLIGNGLKFSPEDAIITISYTIDKDRAIISVADNGIGIEKPYLERIFRVFEKLHGKNEYEGTGIGLTICKRIVERHGGSIRAESELNKGTTFFFDLEVAT